MNVQEFEIEVEKSYLRSKRLLAKKAGEYSLGKDRLDQFKRIGVSNCEAPTESLWGMAVKHVDSIGLMVKDPKMYNLQKWRGKITDLRNYTFLLDALLVDLEVK